MPALSHLQSSTTASNGVASQRYRRYGNQQSVLEGDEPIFFGRASEHLICMGRRGDHSDHVAPLLQPFATNLRLCDGDDAATTTQGSG